MQCINTIVMLYYLFPQKTFTYKHAHTHEHAYLAWWIHDVQFVCERTVALRRLQSLHIKQWLPGPWCHLCDVSCEDVLTFLQVRRAPHPTTGEPWPLPQYYTKKEKTVFTLDPKFSFIVTGNITCDIMEQVKLMYSLSISMHPLVSPFHLCLLYLFSLSPPCLIASFPPYVPYQLRWHMLHNINKSLFKAILLSIVPAWTPECTCAHKCMIAQFNDK